MNATNPSPENPTRHAAPAKSHRYVGEVVYIYAFDVAYDMTRQPVRELLGQPVAQLVVDSSKRHLSFYKPQMVRLPPLERLGPHGPVRVERAVKLLPDGAISITARVPFAMPHIEDLVVYHDLQFSNGALNDEVRQELASYYIRPLQQFPDEEAYTVICLESPMLSRERTPQSAEAWLQTHRRQVATLLTQEPDSDHLSRQESDESTGRHLSYYERDLVVIDWDAACGSSLPISPRLTSVGNPTHFAAYQT